MGWLGQDRKLLHAAKPLIAENDTTFKFHLDRYKYPQRYPQQTQEEHRAGAELFLQELDQRLKGSAFLLGNSLCIADAALFPFVRQFSGVDKDWFSNSPYTSLRTWLETISTMALTSAIMVKYPPWKPDDAPVVISHITNQSPAIFHI